MNFKISFQNGEIVEKILDYTKNLFLDALASVRGFIYGFLVISLVICIIGIVIFLFLSLKNLIT